MTVTITKEERKAINALKRLAKKWPQSLALFSWDGTLVVLKASVERPRPVVAIINGIENDGGDPDCNQVDPDPEIEEEGDQ